MMNERIKELAEQATSIVEMVGPQGYTSSYANFDREKFAELIVRECVVMTKGYEFALGRKDELSKAMSEHFGFE